VYAWAWRLGDIIFGLATFRAGIFPRWAGILLMLAGVMGIFLELGSIAQYLFTALAFAAWVGLGWSLWTRQDRASEPLAAAHATA
jgi:hypothetical protein